MTIKYKQTNAAANEQNTGAYEFPKKKEGGGGGGGGWQLFLSLVGWM